MAHISPVATREELIAMIENREALISDLYEVIEKLKAVAETRRSVPDDTRLLSGVSSDPDSRS